jgi:hypothetical protein
MENDHVHLQISVNHGPFSIAMFVLLPEGTVSAD